MEYFLTSSPFRPLFRFRFSSSFMFFPILFPRLLLLLGRRRRRGRRLTKWLLLCLSASIQRGIIPTPEMRQWHRHTVSRDMRRTFSGWGWLCNWTQWSFYSFRILSLSPFNPKCVSSSLLLSSTTFRNAPRRPTYSGKRGAVTWRLERHPLE